MKIRISRPCFLQPLTAACFIMILAVSALGATFGSDTASTEPNKTEPNKPAETTADSVAVTVNGVDIMESQIDTYLKPQLQKMAAQLPPSFIDQYKKQLKQQVLEKMIIEQLLDEKVKAADINVTEEDVTNKIEEMAAQQQPPLTMEDLKALIEASGKSFEEWKKQMQFNKGLGYQKLMETQWAGKIKVTEDDAKKYYSENKSKFEMPEQVRASHILITPNTNDPNNKDPNQAKAAAKAKAEDLLKQIKAGADFAELAKANSADTASAKKGGDLDFFIKGQMVPTFEEAAFALKPGQVSDVVESQYGYHIIKLTDHKDPNVTSFEQAKEDIIKVLTITKQAEFAEEYVASLKANAKIVYPPGKEPLEPAKPTVTAKPSSDNKPAAEPVKKASDEDSKKKKKTSAK